MKHRQKISLIIGTCILVLATVGGTSAYFVTNKRVRNVVTSGGVNVEIIESAVDDIGNVKEFVDIEDAMPGETYSKIPQVRNIDSGEAWVRARVIEAAVIADGTPIGLTDAFDIDYNLTDWSLRDDGYYYYREVLAKGQTTAPLFTEVTIPKKLGNVYQKSKFGLTVRVQAVQATHNGINATEAVGWPVQN